MKELMWFMVGFLMGGIIGIFIHAFTSGTLFA